MAVSGNQTKKCVRCNAEKPISAFYRRSDRAADSGIGSGCLACYKELMAEIRKIKRGDPKPAIPLSDRFEKYYMPIPWTGCWIWTGGLSTNKKWGSADCGEINVKRADGRWIPEPAYRTSWNLHRGEIPAGQCVLHMCDNRLCVNPDHLFLGTKMDNTMDMMRKGRHFTQRKENVC